MRFRLVPLPFRFVDTRFHFVRERFGLSRPLIMFVGARFGSVRGRLRFAGTRSGLFPSLFAFKEPRIHLSVLLVPAPSVEAGLHRRASGQAGSRHR